MVIMDGRSNVLDVLAYLQRWANEKGNKVINYTIMDDRNNTKTWKPKPSKWHRVEDELPIDTRDVLVRLQEGKVIMGWHDYKWWPNPYVTHWRELPKFKEPERKE